MCLFDDCCSLNKGDHTVWGFYKVIYLAIYLRKRLFMSSLTSSSSAVSLSSSTWKKTFCQFVVLYLQKAYQSVCRPLLVKSLSISLSSSTWKKLSCHLSSSTWKKLVCHFVLQLGKGLSFSLSSPTWKRLICQFVIFYLEKVSFCRLLPGKA